MKKFEENLNNNAQISEELKELARQSFGEVLEMLGREGFKKWLKIQTITNDVKSLIYEWAESEEMDREAEAGTYNILRNIISINNGISSKKDILGVAKHEDLHFFTRHGDLGRICTYLDEGCTEYLKHLSEAPDEKYTYKEQVEIVDFLRSFLGNSIIQTYLTGKKRYFLDDLNNILKEDVVREDEREDKIYEFFYHLDDRHYELQRQNKNYVNLFMGGTEYDEESYFKSDEEFKKNDDEINKFLEKIILCKFKQMAKARTFNKNGQVDEEYAKTIINEKLKKARFIGEEYEYEYFDNNTDLSNFIIEIMMENILYAIRENCNPKIKVNTYCEHMKFMYEHKFYSIQEIYQKVFDGKNYIQMNKFYDYLIKLSSEIGLPPREMCKNYGTEKLCEIITNNSSRNLAVFNLLAEEITSEESHFRKIGDSEYVEQRDGTFIYLKINDDGTIQEEKDLSKVKDIFKIGDTLESIQLINREDDYKELRILNENQFQQVEMVHQMILAILYQKNVNIEDTVKDINIVIKDSKFLSNLVETTLKKRTRLQVMDWINTLTKEEMQEALEQIYDEAVNSSGIREIEQEQDLVEFHKNMYDYEDGHDER